ncbi:MAG: Crp/Fnr family transcriptional regulator [Bdellovibrionales bacterium]
MEQVWPAKVQSHPLFKGLGDAHRDAMLKAGHLRRYEDGQSVFMYGDPVRSFYLVCEGVVQLFRETPDGHELTAAVCLAGDTLGAHEIFMEKNAHHMVNAVAARASHILEFSADWLRENARKTGAFALNVLALLSKESRVACVEAEHKSSMSAAQQVACFLERMCVLHGYDPHGFSLPYSKTLMASRLGMELETFSRALGTLRDYGIFIQGGHVSFRDLAKLESFSCADCTIAGSCQEHEQLRVALAQE